MSVFCGATFQNKMALSSRCILGAFNKTSPFRALFAPCRSVTLVPRQVQPPATETHDARNARYNRPQSPHLTIYKFQLTSMLSITHRITGLALSAYVYGVGAISLVSSKQFPQVVQSLQGLDPALIYSGKFLIAFPFAYHLVNGVRHLVWDSGNALTIKGVYTTGYVMVGVSTVLALILCQL